MASDSRIAGVIYCLPRRLRGGEWMSDNDYRIESELPQLRSILVPSGCWR
jgi:hypothetical protein